MTACGIDPFFPSDHPMTYAIGLDIGGTKIAGAIYDKEGHELRRVIEPMPKDYAAFLNQCVTIVQQLQGASDVGKASLGIGMPGVISRDGDTFYAIANIPFLREGHAFASDLSRLLSRPLRIANDGLCAVLAEAWEGAGKGAETVFGITLGTGVGGGLVVQGHAISGKHGMAGEIGHIPLPHWGPEDGEPVPCRYCLSGCIEGFLSGAAFAKRYEKLAEKVASVAEIVRFAENGDTAAVKTLDDYCRTLAKAMTAIMNMFDPDVIIVSGGMSALPNLLSSTTRYISGYALFKEITTPIVPAKLGTLSGLRGAAILGMQGN